MVLFPETLNVTANPQLEVTSKMRNLTMATRGRGRWKYHNVFADMFKAIVHAIFKKH